MKRAVQVQVVLWDLIVFDIAEYGVSCRLPPDASLEDDFIVCITFFEFKEGACDVVHWVPLGFLSVVCCTFS